MSNSGITGPKDRYIMATGLALAVVSIWHGIASILHEDYQRKADIVMLCVFSASYFIYNCQYIGRIFFGPYRLRRDMRHREAQYVKTVKEQAIEKQSVRRGRFFKGRKDKDKNKDKEDVPLTNVKTE